MEIEEVYDGICSLSSRVQIGNLSLIHTDKIFHKQGKNSTEHKKCSVAVQGLKSMNYYSNSNLISIYHLLEDVAKNKNEKCITLTNISKQF